MPCQRYRYPPQAPHLKLQTLHLLMAGADHLSRTPSQIRPCRAPAAAPASTPRLSFLTWRALRSRCLLYLSRAIPVAAPAEQARRLCRTAGLLDRAVQIFLSQTQSPAACPPTSASRSDRARRRSTAIHESVRD